MTHFKSPRSAADHLFYKCWILL